MGDIFMIFKNFYGIIVIALYTYIIFG